ncbi:universal stress protein [Halopseudomonas salegens]|uniref:Nucleotide-binding universal stress protein, UspA family n=1 Tax=Halopseudomonas salegens TaxID=1434072 RepID=A0A1H2DXW9_9GAMM|nr:universal stress protein [Halopseudomonas salegens]SDT87629.1 Nucleotide-binding universal stress protein, UspA family [Halopseudomonas salegens]
MLKHCIVGVDYSPEWDRTLEYLPAIKLLAGLEHLTLVHVVESFKRQRTRDQPGAAEGHLKHLAEQLSADLGIAVDYVVRSGFAASEILEVAKTRAADGIIALNRSHSASREVLIGNIVINLARMTRIPLLVIASDGAIAEPGAPIILGTDGSAPAKAAQHWFEGFVRQGNHGLALWVDADEHDDEEEAHRSLSNLSSAFSNVATRRLKGDATDQLVKTASEEKAALLIIGKRGNTPIQDLLIGSTAESVVRESRQPVLLIPT